MTKTKKKKIHKQIFGKQVARKLIFIIFKLFQLIKLLKLWQIA